MSHLSGYGAAYTNPSLLAKTPTKRLALGVQSVRFNLDADPADGVSLDDSAGALQFGVHAPLPFPPPVANRLVLGLSVSAPGSKLVRVRITKETRPQFPLLANRAESLNFNIGLGARLPGGWYIGAGSMVLAGLQGTVLVDADANGTTENVTNDELILDHAPVLGVAFEPTPNWRFGLGWRSQLRADFDLVVTVQNLGIDVPPLAVNGLAQVDPAQLSAELSHQQGPWLFIAGITYKRWSAIDGFRDATVQCPPEESDCAALGDIKLSLADTLVPRVAISRSLSLRPGATAHLRLGYFHEATPFPAQRDELRVFDNPRNVLTAGYGIALSDPFPEFALNFAAQYHLLTRRVHPTQPEPSHSGGHALLAGLTAEVGF